MGAPVLEVGDGVLGFSGALREVPGTSVRLVYDVERTDRYGRTLPYVYRVADDLFVKLQMV